MQITQEVREQAARMGAAEGETIAAGMEEKAKEFLSGGAEIYRP